MDTRVMELRDERELAWSEAGDPDGVPVLGFHGTPGSRHQLLVDEEPIRSAGARWIVPDRPGYGLSSWHRGRTLLDWATDVEQLADHLGLQRFAVVGVSGGGPHALVCAARLGSRVTAAATVSGVGPMAEPGREEGMMPANRLFARLARRAPALNRIPLGAMTIVGKRMPDRALELGAKQAPAPDAAVLARPEVTAALRKGLVRASATSGRAAADDFRLFARDWGFRLQDIAVPVHVWQGDADVNVPGAHGRLLADRIPGAELHWVEGEGHLMVVDHLGEVLAPLVAAP